MSGCFSKKSVVTLMMKDGAHLYVAHHIGEYVANRLRVVSALYRMID